MTYITYGTRAAQDNYTMCRYIMNSVKKNTLKRISTQTVQYHIQGYASGNCLFKVITCESRLDIKSTTSHICKSLTTLDKYMHEIGDNILKFNTYVKGLIRSLTECGEQTYDLITYLTKGYLAYRNKAFRKYITDLIECDEDDHTLVLTPDLLIVYTANKYKSLLQNHTQKKPDNVEKELIALKAEVQRHHKQVA